MVVVVVVGEWGPLVALSVLLVVSLSPHEALRSSFKISRKNSTVFYNRITVFKPLSQIYGDSSFGIEVFALFACPKNKKKEKKAPRTRLNEKGAFLAYDSDK